MVEEDDMRDDLKEALVAIAERLDRLEHQADLIKTVLMVKEPGAVMAADAYEGLRKQVVASAGERRAHLGQLTSMAVAVSRATDVEDLRVQVHDWLSHSGIDELRSLPDGRRPEELFEFVDGSGPDAEGMLQVLEPAYVDRQTGVLLRTGRGRRTAPPAMDRVGPAPAAPTGTTAATSSPRVAPEETL